MEARNVRQIVLVLLALVGALYILYRVLCQVRLECSTCSAATYPQRQL